MFKDISDQTNNVDEVENRLIQIGIKRKEKQERKKLGNDRRRRMIIAPSPTSSLGTLTPGNYSANSQSLNEKAR